MQLPENPIYRKIYLDLITLTPLNKTDRKQDLKNLNNLEQSFILYSPARNGTTTLLKTLEKEKDGLLIYFPWTIKEAKREIKKAGKNVVLFDEGGIFLHHNKYKPAFEYCINQSKTKQLGLRIHPQISKEKLKPLTNNGFYFYEMGQQPYEEYKSMILTKFASIDFKFPEEEIKKAHESFSAICPSNAYIAEYFKAMVESPEKLNENYIKKQLYYYHHNCRVNNPDFFD